VIEVLFTEILASPKQKKCLLCCRNSSVASPKIWEGSNISTKRATLFGLGHRLSKNKTTRYARNLGKACPLWPLSTRMCQKCNLVIIGTANKG